MTGEQVYYDAYMNELNVLKSRDKALEALRKERIKDHEWVIIDHIAEMSNGLVPLEEEALQSLPVRLKICQRNLQKQQDRQEA